MSEPTWPQSSPSRDAASLIFNLPGYTVLDAVDLPLGGRRIIVRAGAQDEGCPDCGVISTRVHAWTSQRVKDIPAGVDVVEVVVRKPRYLCAEPACGRRTSRPRSPPSPMRPGRPSSTRTRSTTRPSNAGSATPRSPRSTSLRSPDGVRPSTWPVVWSCGGSNACRPWPVTAPHRAEFATYRHHAFITNSTLGLVEADQTHRGHAVIEQVIAELKDGALAHLPSGKYTANAAWLAHAVIAFNLARATAVAAGQLSTRWDTVRTRVTTPQPGSPPPGDGCSCTYRPTGPGPPPGNNSGPSRPGHHQPRPDHPGRRRHHPRTNWKNRGGRCGRTRPNARPGTTRPSPCRRTAPARSLPGRRAPRRRGS